MNHLVLILKKTLETVHWESPPSEFIHRGELFNRPIPTDFNGFYDWLRESSGGIVGIRFSLFENFPALAQESRKLSYVDYEELSSGDAVLRIFFSESRDVNEEKSADQLFVDDYIYRSRAGVFAFSVPTPERQNDQTE